MRGIQSPGSRRLWVVSQLLILLLAGCGSPATTAGPTIIASPSAAASASPAAPRSLPPSQIAIEPGRYGWDGFRPSISFEVGQGWEVGHRHPEFFDLFADGDFPAISFGRFDNVFTDATTRVPARDVATVVASLSGRPELTLSRLQPTELAGLRGQAFNLTATATQTPLFGGTNGVFRMDPGFETRYSALDVPGGGVLLVGVVAREGELEVAWDAAASVLASLAVDL